MADTKSSFQNIKPVFAGKIGCGMRFRRSRRRTADTYRSVEARLRRRQRKLYREMQRGMGGGKGFKSWLRNGGMRDAA